EPELQGAEQGVWLERLEAENDNLRSALGWSLGNAEPEMGLRLASSLGRFWEVHGYWAEGRAWLERALSRAEALPVAAGPEPSAHAKAFYTAGLLAKWQDDYGQAKPLLEKGLALYRDLGDKPGMTRSLEELGHLAVVQGDLATGRSLQEKSLAISREL